MHSSLATLALLSTVISARNIEKRQATNGEQFTAAADQLISAYIPSTVLPVLEGLASAGASAASITGDPASILHSALLATELPDWLESVIPSAYSSNLQALESNINELRGTVGVPLVPVVIPVTTTNADGDTITTSLTTSVPDQTGAVSILTTDVVDGVTSVYSTAVSGASSVVGEATEGAAGVVTTVVDGVTSVVSTAVDGASSVQDVVTTEVVDGVTSVFTTAVSGASSVLSEATSGASSILSEATEGASSIISEATDGAAQATVTSAAGAAGQTALAGAAAGVLGMVGLMAAL